MSRFQAKPASLLILHLFYSVVEEFSFPVKSMTIFHCLLNIYYFLFVSCVTLLWMQSHTTPLENNKRKGFSMGIIRWLGGRRWYALAWWAILSGETYFPKTFSAPTGSCSYCLLVYFWSAGERSYQSAGAFQALVCSGSLYAWRPYPDIL